MFEDENKRSDVFDALFDGLLKPLHSKNARRIFNIFYNKRYFDHLTTYDLEPLLEAGGLSISKKEINAWLVSLQDAGLIIKMENRGKPVVSVYTDRYTFDLWRLSETGLNVGQKLPIIMAKEEPRDIPQLAELTPNKIHEIEDLYLTSKILLILHDHNGGLNYSELRKQLAIDREKLAVYSWPDASHSEKPLFEIKTKQPTFRTRVFKLFGWVQEQDLIFTLTETGKNMAMKILSKERTPET
jgi:DNA-binding transcriptional ArsR family regulator